MLTFANFNILGMPVDAIALRQMYVKHLARHKILVDMGSTWVLKPIEKKLAISSVKNRIPLKEDSPKRKELGRDYMESERLTEAQHNIFVDSVYKYFQSLGISFDVTFQEFADDPTSITTIIAQGKVVGALPTPKSFPLAA